MADPDGPHATRPGRDSSPEAAHRAALDFLARRSHFESELQRKLERKGFERADAHAALDRLRRAALVDDRRTALELIAAKLRRAPQGRRRLRAELTRRGVAPEVVEAALEEALPRDEAALASEAARRFRRRRANADTRALQRHLDRLGFSSHDILTLADEPLHPEPPDDGS